MNQLLLSYGEWLTYKRLYGKDWTSYVWHRLKNYPKKLPRTRYQRKLQTKKRKFIKTIAYDELKTD